MKFQGGGPGPLVKFQGGGFHTPGPPSTGVIAS